MLYRTLTPSRVKIPQLGFGCMRFPTVKADGKDIINEDEAIKMVLYALENGVNYFDTAVFYHEGESETLLGKALKGIDRDKYLLADKFPVGHAKSEASMEEVLDNQLKKLQTDYVDFYMLHGIGESSIETIEKFNLLKKAEELKAKGKIRHFGFSFHDNYGAFVKLVDYYDKWEFCQIQYNYLDEYNQATTKGLEYAYGKGLSVIIMEPLRGGVLTSLPSDVKEVFAKVDAEKSAADWALSWLWDRKEVSIILSGMSSPEQLKENIKIASRAKIGDFSDEMKEAVKEAYLTFENRIKVNCTDCKYCMPCPSNVDIPFNFKLFNNDYRYDNKKSSQWQYFNGENKDKTAKNCTGCKICEKKCPQKIEIAALLSEFAANYAGE